MNKLLSLMQWMLPSDSFVPLTEEMLWKVAGAETPRSISIDVCGVCNNHIYGNSLPKSERLLGEVCPCCRLKNVNSPRFTKQQNGVLVPVHSMYYVGVEKALQQAFNDPDVVSRREEEGARPFHSEGSLWRSQCMSELNTNTQNALWTTNQDGTRDYHLSSTALPLDDRGGKNIYI